jgi:hypothetical protein
MNKFGEIKMEDERRRPISLGLVVNPRIVLVLRHGLRKQSGNPVTNRQAKKKTKGQNEPRTVDNPLMSGQPSLLLS